MGFCCWEGVPWICDQGFHSHIYPLLPVDLGKEPESFDGALTLHFHAFTHCPPHSSPSPRPQRFQCARTSAISLFFGQKFPLSANCLGGKWICSSVKKKTTQGHVKWKYCSGCLRPWFNPHGSCGSCPSGWQGATSGALQSLHFLLLELHFCLHFSSWLLPVISSKPVVERFLFPWSNTLPPLFSPHGELIQS